MTRLTVSGLAASLVGVGSLLTGCASGAHGVQTTHTTGDYHPVPIRTAAGSGYSVAAVKAAFSSVGVYLRPFPSSGGKLSGTWVDLIGNQPHPIHVNVRLGPYRGRYKHPTYGLSAVGSNRAEYRNVLLAWTPDDQAVVMGALHTLTRSTDIFVPKNSLIVPAVSMGVVRFREPRKAVARALGPGRRIGRYYRSYLHGRLRILYSYHDTYTGRAQALITKWSGYRTRSGAHVGSPRQALDGLHLKCANGTCSSGKNPDYPGTIFFLRHGRVVEIFVGAS